MSDLREIGAAVARGVVPPDLADLEQVAGARRRTRNRLVGTAAVAAAIIVLWLSPAGRLLSERAATPAGVGPSPTTSTKAQQWTAADIVDEVQSRVLYSVDAGDPATRLRSLPASDQDGWVTVWHRCGNMQATEYISDCGGEMTVALEVKSDNGAVDPLLVRLSDGSTPDVRYVGDGTFYVASGRDLELLVKAGMREPVRLTRSPTTVPPEPGMETVPCFNSEGGVGSNGQFSPRGGACTIDVAARRLTPVALPNYAVADWSPQTTGGFWGLVRGDRDRLVVQTAGGGFEERSVRGALGADMELALNAPPGTIAVFSRYVDPNSDLCCPQAWHNLRILGLLHVSNDRGQTWRILKVPEGVEGSLDPRLYVTYVPELPDGWESWPEFKP